MIVDKTSERLHQSSPSLGETIPVVKVPVLQEELVVGKRVVDTGKGVRIQQTVHEEEEIVRQMLMQESVSVERVLICTLVDPENKPQIRHDGDTMIIPIFDEVLVVEKKLRLKEELHIKRQQADVESEQRVMLRSSDVTVERFDKSKESPGFDSGNATER